MEESCGIMLDFSQREYSIRELFDSYKRGETVLSPKFQRRPVWEYKAKSYLIDTIISGFPIPRIFIREKTNLDMSACREIIDGQQRLKTIFDFLNDGFRISKVHSQAYGGCCYSELPDGIKKDFLKYPNDAHYLSTDQLKTIRDLVVKQAFVSVFTEWEHFLEDMTIAYALGKENLAGYCPQRYVLPQDEEHADQLIKSSTTYFDWSKIDDVVKLENSFFHNGEPFVAAIQGFRSKYNDMKKVRNVIVHNSIKSRDQFDTLVRNALRASAVGISPVEFLLSKKNPNPFFYSIYITHIRNAATIIANYSPVPQAEAEPNPN